MSQRSGLQKLSLKASVASLADLASAESLHRHLFLCVSCKLTAVTTVPAELLEPLWLLQQISFFLEGGEMLVTALPAGARPFQPHTLVTVSDDSIVMLLNPAVQKLSEAAGLRAKDLAIATALAAALGRCYPWLPLSRRAQVRAGSVLDLWRALKGALVCPCSAPLFYSVAWPGGNRLGQVALDHVISKLELLSEFWPRGRSQNLATSSRRQQTHKEGRAVF